MSDSFWYMAFLGAFALAGYFAVRATKRDTDPNRLPAERSPLQQKMHLIGVALLVVALIYFLFVGNFEPIPFLVLLSAQILPMLVLRSFRVRWQVRAWLLPFVAIASVFVAAYTLIWPSHAISSLPSHVWFTLAFTSSLAAASGLLSIFSFPIGYGERAS
jgi:hypothetical protein